MHKKEAKPSSPYFVADWGETKHPRIFYSRASNLFTFVNFAGNYQGVYSTQHEAQNYFNHYKDATEPRTVANLEVQITALRKEIAYLRHFGNKDCTALADEALANGAEI
jgi:hypothetical protein